MPNSGYIYLVTRGVIHRKENAAGDGTDGGKQNIIL